MTVSTVWCVRDLLIQSNCKPLRFYPIIRLRMIQSHLAFRNLLVLTMKSHLQIREMQAVLCPSSHISSNSLERNQINGHKATIMGVSQSEIVLGTTLTPIGTHCTSPATSSAAAIVGEPFGTVLGLFEGVEVKSCLLPEGKKALDMEVAYYNGIRTGVQWQCVELARRYLLQVHGIIFDCIPLAHDMFPSAVFRHVHSRQPVSVQRIPHGSEIRPVKGSLLIWRAVGRYAPTGHVAVVVDATDSHVDVIEQNFFHTMWPIDRQYSRRLPVLANDGTGYHIAKHFEEEELLGWITLDI